MGFKRRRNRGINWWFSILIDRYKLQDHMSSKDTALECSYTDIYIILKIIRYNFLKQGICTKISLLPLLLAPKASPDQINLCAEVPSL